MGMALEWSNSTSYTFNYEDLYQVSKPNKRGLVRHFNPRMPLDNIGLKTSWVQGTRSTRSNQALEQVM